MPSTWKIKEVSKRKTTVRFDLWPGISELLSQAVKAPRCERTGTGCLQL
jgi:hypothetical protein